MAAASKGSLSVRMTKSMSAVMPSGICMGQQPIRQRTLEAGQVRRVHRVRGRPILVEHASLNRRQMIAEARQVLEWQPRPDFVEDAARIASGQCSHWHI